MDPINNPETNEKRREYIYKTMLEMGTLTQEEYEQCLNTDIVIN
jgi:penicillin-binding protein 1A